MGTLAPFIIIIEQKISDSCIYYSFILYGMELWAEFQGFNPGQWK